LGKEEDEESKEENKKEKKEDSSLITRNKQTQLVQRKIYGTMDFFKTR